MRYSTAALSGHFSMYEMIRFVAHRLREFGYRINLVQTDAAEPLRETYRHLAAEEGDGLLLIDWVPDALNPLLCSLAGHAIPAVSIGTMADAAYSWSVFDHVKSMRVALDHLLGRGAKHIAWLGCYPDSWLNTIKRRAYAEWMAMHRFTSPSIVAPPSMAYDEVIRTVHDYLAAQPATDALLLADNFIAPAVQSALAGRPIRLLGYGDACFAELPCHPPIPYMRMPIQAVAGVDILFAMLQKPGRPPRQKVFRASWCCLATMQASRPTRATRGAARFSR